MKVTRENLVKYFQLLNDEQLLADFRSGELTELAEEIAAEELRRRNIEASKISNEPAIPARPASFSGDLALVARYFNPVDAHMLKNRLELEGVLAVVADDNMAQMVLPTTVGGVRVLVPEAHLQRAREIAEAVERGDYALDD